MKYFILVGIVSIIGGFTMEGSYELKDTDKVWEVLEKLGEDGSSVKPDYSIPNVSAEVGKDIVLNGFSKIKGEKKSKRQSKHFVCTSCHNVEREDPDLTSIDPQARLLYTDKKGLPFLQGSPLYGVSNREYYYNGDYDKKYGDLVEPAREDLREAVKLCAVECAQGRTLKDWEIESIMAYLWDIQLTIEDLQLTDTEKSYIANSMQDSLSWLNASVILRSKYVSYSPATFVKPPDDRKKGTGLTGVPDNGKLIYENSCLHCHYQKKFSYLNLDNSQMSFNHLDSKAPTYNRNSLYQVVRYGTYSKNWKKSYMPQYTEEKMTEQMLADLRAYIAVKS